MNPRYVHILLKELFINTLTATDDSPVTSDNTNIKSTIIQRQLWYTVRLRSFDRCCIITRDGHWRRITHTKHPVVCLRHCHLRLMLFGTLHHCPAISTTTTLPHSSA